jgi:hypothetical protein
LIVKKEYIFICLLLFLENFYAQFKLPACTEITYSLTKNAAPFGGVNKPERTDYSGVPDYATFPILIVFVQFLNDLGPNVDYWPVGSPPVFLNQMIAENKKYPVNDNWWDTYSETNELLSDSWLEFSRGHLHITGKAYSVILDHDNVYYVTHGGINQVNDEIYQKLNTMGIDWKEYDRWSFVADPGNFRYQPDGYIDMIYKIHRSHAPLIGMPAGGIAMLGYSFSQGVNYLIDPVNNIYINGGFSSIGSGITITPGHGGSEGSDYSPNGALDLRSTVSFSEHEHGHYIFGPGHGNYGKMSADFGWDEMLSPWESIYLGYMKPQMVDFTDTPYYINDFSSRTSDEFGEVLQVPIAGFNEFFLIANRMKVSTYDKIMYGDTAHGNPYRTINEDYGKGVYIYHNSTGYIFPPAMDQECADGIYKWLYAGTRHPDWSNEQLIDYYVRSSVIYDNDQSGNSDVADGKSIYTWFSTGVSEGCIGCDGTDKEYTNIMDVWTSREWQGDRWDAWREGYNEIFSPYSSPSTNSWSNQKTGIFIYLNGTDYLNNARFKIYKAGESGLSETDILALTPPSKPMGLKLKFTECSNDVMYPEIYWNQNSEPDMLLTRPVPLFDAKTYRIYKSRTDDAGSVPLNYFLYDEIKLNAKYPAEYIDYKDAISCSQLNHVLNVRYKISAVDKDNYESVKSDFTSYSLRPGNLTIDNFMLKNDPLEYGLLQNYPNPFNPVTSINFTIARESRVFLKVYDLQGKEIKTLIDGILPKGNHSVSFNAENLASGIYIYRLQSPFFTASKKMVIIK